MFTREVRVNSKQMLHEEYLSNYRKPNKCNRLTDRWPNKMYIYDV